MKRMLRKYKDNVDNKDKKKNDTISKSLKIIKRERAKIKEEKKRIKLENVNIS